MIDQVAFQVGLHSLAVYTLRLIRFSSSKAEEELKARGKEERRTSAADILKASHSNLPTNLLSKDSSKSTSEV